MLEILRSVEGESVAYFTRPPLVSLINIWLNCYLVLTYVCICIQGAAAVLTIVDSRYLDFAYLE